MPLNKARISQSFSVPTIVKTSADTNDFFIGIDVNNQLFLISKTDLLAGYSTGSGGTGSGGTGSGSTGFDQYFSNVSLLLPFNGSFVDVKGNMITPSGDIAITSTGMKYGTGCASFFGNGGNLSIPNSNAFNLTGRDFTIECWINTTNTSSAYHTIIDKYNASGSSGSFQLTQTGTRIEFYYSSFSNSVPLLASNNGSVSTNTWYFVSVTRSGNTFTLYLDGIAVATATHSSAGLNPNIPINIGSQAGTVNWFFGKIDEVRITVDISRNPAVPTAGFPQQ